MMKKPTRKKSQKSRPDPTFPSPSLRERVRVRVNLLKSQKSSAAPFWVIVLFLSIALMFTGCLKKKPSLGYRNIPPETFVFIEGEIDTVTAKQKICWYGNDPDGKVVGFDWAIDDTSIKTYTEVNCSTFIFTSGAEPITHFFYVWAIDDSGAIDTTPAMIKIPVINSPPEVYLDTYRVPPDTSFPIATFFWTGEDEDGNETITGYRFKLDYWGDWSFVPPETTHVTLRDITPGERTFMIQAFDEAGAVSDTSFWTWTVIPAKGEILVVEDNHGDSTSLLFENFLENVGVEFSVWDISKRLPASSQDIYSVINELGFKTILWASGDTCRLENIGDALGPYLDSGKNLLVSSKGLLTSELSDFLRNYFHVDTVSHPDKPLLKDAILRGEVNGYPDSLKINAPIIARVDGFEPDTSAETLYRGPQRYLEKSSVALRYPRGGPARLVLFTFPLAMADGLGNVSDLLHYVIFEEFKVGKKG